MMCTFAERIVFDSEVMACAAGRSSVRVVPRTADVKLSKSTALRPCFYCKEAKPDFLESIMHIRGINVRVMHIFKD